MIASIDISKDACDSCPNVLPVLQLRTHLPALELIALLVDTLSGQILIIVLEDHRIGTTIVRIVVLVLLHLSRRYTHGMLML